jgi:hypothetical protein
LIDGAATGVSALQLSGGGRVSAVGLLGSRLDRKAVSRGSTMKAAGSDGAIQTALTA